MGMEDLLALETPIANVEQSCHPPPGLEPPAGMPSVGSILHGTGRCQPCGWFWKKGGCSNGASCRRYHLCPEGEIRSRKKVKASSMRLAGTLKELHERPTHVSAPAVLDDEAHHGQKKVAHQCFSDLHSASVTHVRSAGKSAEAASIVAQSDPAAPVEMLQGNCPIPELPSQGSALHFAGSCQPCAWFWQEGGCHNGHECRRCHLCPKGEVKNRRRMKFARMRAERLGSNSLNGSMRSSHDSKALSGSEQDSLA